MLEHLRHFLAGKVPPQCKKGIEPDDSNQPDDAGVSMDLCQVKSKLQIHVDYLQKRSDPGAVDTVQSLI